MRLVSFAALAAVTIAAAPAGPMTKGERQRLIAHFEMTERWLSDEVAGLTPAQSKFQPEPGSWSVLNVLDHLVVAEPHYWKTLLDSMKTEPATEKGDVTDDMILWYGIDRTNRARTAEAREPKGQHPDLPSALEVFRKLRATMLEYARTTDKDLRAYRYLNSKTDLYQWFLMISAHSQRHILQIREIKRNPKFPK
jgi:hypothetical protein